MLKLKNIENEMDIRVEPMISEINNYRDHYRLQLNKYKIELQKYILIIFEIKYSNNISFNFYSLITNNNLVDSQEKKGYIL
jgi:hypothetical protein